MSDYQEQPWSDNPIAPKIPHNLYFGEKANFAGVLIGSILHGAPEIHPPARSSIRAHFAYTGHSRDPHRTVLQMYECAA